MGDWSGFDDSFIYDCSHNPLTPVFDCSNNNCCEIDLALLNNENFTLAKKTSKCQIYLEPIDIPWCVFRMLFFYNNGVFTPNESLVRFDKTYLQYITNSCQHVQPNVAKGCCGHTSVAQQFNLFSILKREFSDIANNCWSTCTKINYNKKISKLKTLFDMNLCNIRCSLTLDELIDTMQDQGITINPTTGCPESPANNNIIINITTQFTALEDTTTDNYYDCCKETPPHCVQGKTVEIVWQYQICA